MSTNDIPTPGRGDLLHSVAKAGLSAIPIFGGPASELFTALVTPPLERRRRHWCERVGERLQELEERGMDLASLRQNEEFITTVMQVTHAALRSHQQEKLEALSNAVMNTACGRAPEDSVREMFIVLVDTLTVWHLRLLKFLDDPPAWTRDHGTSFGNLSSGGISSFMERAIPELKGRRDFYDILVRDLHARNLIPVQHLHTMMTLQGVLSSHTTEFGRSFLSFIGNVGEEEGRVVQPLAMM